ncbi:MAG: ROK family protein [Nitrospirae bacterium]|jgi:glucokinase|nr:ROK family protein [Nitrospirota bacterium]MCL5062384.1 ROK family protein [Nitrospirota bacterium]MDA8215816.1 ROK family protein [Nitrospiraceae bacterium]MDA8338505.1 ROK family protein [Nitrospiraceae bacterium]
MVKNYAIGVDIGGTNIRAALINSSGEVESKVKESTGRKPVAVLHKLIDSLYSKHSKQICGIGLAVAGIIDRDEGIVLRSPNIQGLTGVNLEAEVKSRYKTCIVVENDANAAAYGEKCAGAGRDFKSFVIFTLGTGIGGGIVMNNKLLSVAAEVGHMSINANGQQCACGNVGCLESYASASAIIGNAVSEAEKGNSSILRNLYNGNFYKLNAEDIYKAALDGDVLSRSVLREAGKSLGIGIANLINILSPDAIILTGGLLGAWNIYVDSAIQEASKRALKELYAKVKIIPSSLGDNAGIIGAAKLVFEECNFN